MRLKVQMAEQRPARLVRPTHLRPRRCPAEGESCSANRGESRLSQPPVNPGLTRGETSRACNGSAAAVTTAAKTLRDLRVAEVIKQDVTINDDGSIDQYRSRLSVSFKYQED